MEMPRYLITNDAITLGLLMMILGFVFYTSNSSHPGLRKFYSIIPMLLLCYFLPSLLTNFDLNRFGSGQVFLVDGENSQLYYVASRYLLPACLVLLTLSVDLREIARLGFKPVTMFLVGTVGVIIGGPLAILATSVIAPDVVGGVGPEAVWRGLATVAGSWIGGGANQAAMYTLYEPSDSLFSVMVTVDVIVAEVWMAFLLLGIGHRQYINRVFRADASAVDHLRDKMETFSQSISRNPSTTDLVVLLAIGFGATAISHLLSSLITPPVQTLATHLQQLTMTSDSMLLTVAAAIVGAMTSGFFWLIILSTAIGVGLSFTRLRNYEGAGASKIGTVFIFVLVATIGMKMDTSDIREHWGLFVVGGIWMIIHVILLVIAAFILRAPYFFLAIGSKANIGGAASAPVLAAAFHPALAPVGVLLAVLGYILGTVGAMLCAGLMKAVSM